MTRAREGVLVACGAAALGLRIVVNHFQAQALEAALGPYPMHGDTFDYNRRFIELSWPHVKQMLALQIGVVVALLVASFVARSVASGLRLGALAAVVVFLCANFAHSFRFVIWNVPFWLVVAGVIAHFGKNAVVVRNVTVALALLGAAAILTA